jgi:NifU-like protein involved in Fe-S cluster formation
MLNEIYSRRILELAASIPHLGRLADPDASASAHSRLCGSTVIVDLKVEDGRVTDFAHEVKACALGQASSSVMGRNVLGSTVAELRTVRDATRRMLKEGGSPPEGRWSDLAAL